MQKSAIRIVSGASYNAHTEPLFKKLEILPLPYLISFTKIQFMHRFTQKFLPTSFCDTWVQNSIRNIGENKIKLRNHDQIQHFHSNMAKLDIFPLFHFLKIWQDFGDKQIKIIRKPTAFDSKLKNYFLNDLSTIVICDRLLRPTFVSGLFCRPSEQLEIDEWSESVIVVFFLGVDPRMSCRFCSRDPSYCSYFYHGYSLVSPVASHS